MSQAATHELVAKQIGVSTQTLICRMVEFASGYGRDGYS